MVVVVVVVVAAAVVVVVVAAVVAVAAFGGAPGHSSGTGAIKWCCGQCLSAHVRTDVVLVAVDLRLSQGRPAGFAGG